MSPKRSRTRGLESPYSAEQKMTMVLHPIATAVSFWLTPAVLAANDVSGNHVAVGWAVVALSACTSASLLACWAAVVIIDPSVDTAPASGCTGCSGGTERPYYCLHCRKRVPGFDHHCAWLNTCIGRRNYVFFYGVALSGTVQYAVATTVAVLLLASPDWRDAVAGWSLYLGGGGAFRAVLGVFLLLAAPLLAAFVALLGFHTYLRGWLRMGTYDWVNLQAAAEDERHRKANAAMSAAAETEVEARRKREREAWAQRMHEKQKKAQVAPPSAAAAVPAYSKAPTADPGNLACIEMAHVPKGGVALQATSIGGGGAGVGE